jgi:hypothetical protein
MLGSVLFRMGSIGEWWSQIYLDPYGSDTDTLDIAARSSGAHSSKSSKA